MHVFVFSLSPSISPSLFLSHSLPTALTCSEEIQRESVLQEQDATHPEPPSSKATVEQQAMEKCLCLSGLHGYHFTLQLLLILLLS